MAKLRFTDGVEIETGGPLRAFRLHDGLYVCGQGFCIPVADDDDARRTIESLQTIEKIDQRGRS